MEKGNLVYIDLFAGCGGMSLGLANAGWKGFFAIEKDSMAFETLRFNLIEKRKHFDWPKWLPLKEHDIKEVIENYSSELKSLKGKIDLVVGGPPCQGFSLAGRRKEKDHRNKMVDLYIEFIGLVEPKMLFFENVRGFTIGFKKKDSRGRAYSDYVWEKLKNLGYNTHGEILDFSDFGVPQRRKRFILVGTKNGNPKRFFDDIVSNRIEFLQRKGLKEKTTIKEAISDLERVNGEISSIDSNNFKEGVYSDPKSNYQRFLRKKIIKSFPDSHRFPKHNEKTIKKFMFILKNCIKGKNINSRIKLKFNLKKRCVIPLPPNQASPTLTTLPDDYIHYSEPRILTVREYARIQSFEDNFEFKGKYTTGGKLRTKEVPRYTQIGNAIPPLFGEQSGKVLKEILPLC
jgi:DNA (cytosine-5)-methyltransferase 1